MSGVACSCGRALRYDPRTRRAVCDSCSGNASGGSALGGKVTKRAKERLQAAKTEATPFHNASESAVQARLIGLLRQRGFMVVRFNSGQAKMPNGNNFAAYYVVGLHNPKSRSGRNVSAGFPDVSAMRPREDFTGATVNEIFMIEVKKAGGTLSDSQKNFIGWARDHGLRVHICEDWDHAEELVASLPE